VIDANQVPRLSASHKICVILTVAPAAPNDERKLYKVTVKPGDVESILPGAAKRGLGNARGPTWRVRVGAGLPGAMAMIRWVDSRAEDIDKMLGILDGPPNLEGLVMNAEEQSKLGSQGASLNEIARATAARIYARYADHNEGEITSALTPNARLDGWVDEIIHRIETNGIAGTTARFPDKGHEIDFWSLLDSSTRALLRQEVQK
jgi:hypothetical protein